MLARTKKSPSDEGTVSELESSFPDGHVYIYVTYRSLIVDTFKETRIRILDSNCLKHNLTYIIFYVTMITIHFLYSRS